MIFKRKQYGFIDSYFFSIPERKLFVGYLVFLINIISGSSQQYVGKI